jgi:hypothetical protein
MTISPEANKASFDANGTPGMMAHDPSTNDVVKVFASDDGKMQVTPLGIP